MATEIEINLEEKNDVSMEVKDTGNAEIGVDSDFEGTTDYTKLKNKPSINGVTLQGNKTLVELGIQASEKGKGLSTNDFTDSFKEKLEGLENYDDTGIKEYIDETLGNITTVLDIVNGEVI